MQNSNLNCFTTSATDTVKIVPIIGEQFSSWLTNQNDLVKNWVNVNNFTAKAESFCLVPDANGKLQQILLGVKTAQDFWPFGALPYALSGFNCCIEGITEPTQMARIAIAWGLGAYRFTRYKKSEKIAGKLLLPENCDRAHIENVVSAIYLVRDLINTPTDHMGPEELANAALNLGKTFNAQISQIMGDDLLTRNYPAIHAVGRASSRAPRLVDLRWGKLDAPKITLVGKGVCFDTGGLDLKNASGMALMKKDMGGAAHALGLAQMIMTANLPVRLRVLFGAVENVVSGNAYKPGDIINTRKGLTVEIGNTDAEGRLILADALAEAVTEKPELLIDFSTLTGAARVAVGTDIAAFFTEHDQLAQKIEQYAQQEQDPIWRLPLFSAYRKMLDTPFADINNSGNSPYAGAITAGLFLKEFVPSEIPWLHFDFMAWNLSSRPGKPEGAEAMTLRAVFEYLQTTYAR